MASTVVWTMAQLLWRLLGCTCYNNTEETPPFRLRLRLHRYICLKGHLSGSLEIACNLTYLNKGEASMNTSLCIHMAIHYPWLDAARLLKHSQHFASQVLRVQQKADTQTPPFAPDCTNKKQIFKHVLFLPSFSFHKLQMTNKRAPPIATSVCAQTTHSFPNMSCLSPYFISQTADDKQTGTTTCNFMLQFYTQTTHSFPNMSCLFPLFHFTNCWWQTNGHHHPQLHASVLYTNNTQLSKHVLSFPPVSFHKLQMTNKRAPPSATTLLAPVATQIATAPPQSLVWQRSCRYLWLSSHS